MAKQIRFLAGELWDAVPEGDLPATITFKGVKFTIEQVSTIHNTIRDNIEIWVQRQAQQRLAVRTVLMPVGMWLIYEPDGSFDYTPEVKERMIEAGRQ